jgi:hypothetical protein
MADLIEIVVWRWLSCRQLAFSLLAGIVSLSSVAYGDEQRELQFGTDIRPIFVEHCVACHGGVKQAGGLSLVYEENVLAGGDSGQPAVVPGDVDASYLIERVTSSDVDSRMPPADHGPALSAEEVDRLKRWIQSGAKWEAPWAFRPPQQPSLPSVRQADWCRLPLDRFVLARLEAAGMAPAPPAQKLEWLRRVTFDLIGLPPTAAEIADFEQDQRTDAHERVVDRLLASPHFGERWASMWLDLARYADTTGYEQDPHRDIWPYRDWVIRAFNADMPYDDFTVKQLAGDLLESPSMDDMIATAFHRNTQTNLEGGTDDEEFRIAAVIDRVNTTWQVWQATTFGCVQCHSHPYDPIQHDEYYQCMAFFNQSLDTDVEEDLPRLTVPLDRKDFLQAMQLERRKSELRRELYEFVKPLAEDSRMWRTLPIDRAASSGSTRLKIESQASDNGTSVDEVLAQGTVTRGSKFTVESPLPDDIEQITALRIDALVQDREAARRIPQIGFVLSQLKVELLPAGSGAPVELKFARAFSDEAEPSFDPVGSLRKDTEGWSSYSRQWRSHYAVFLLEKAIQVSPGSRLRICLSQDRGTIGDAALVIGRSRYSISSHDGWTTLQQRRDFVAAEQELASLKDRSKQINGTSIPIMRELPPDQRRSTFTFIRGLWLDKGDEVQPGTPAALPPLPIDESPTRLTLAQWLVSESNPLTARVMVNRVWEQLFGLGIVETTEDFGTSGVAPSNPELLDHLALRFRDEYHWRLKLLLRELVLSSTYRQSAQADPAQWADDPQNRLLARGPRQRLSAEMIRDQALVLSGRFAPKMYGPPVMPPQPDGIWRSVYSQAKWTNAEGEDRYRRAIYTYWKRTSGYPGMTTFDAPSREVCTARRIVTNTPLQALVTLNDEAYVECAEGFADRAIAAGGDTPSDQISWAYRAATGHAPSAETLHDLERLYSQALQDFTDEHIEPSTPARPPATAAMSVVTSAILNLDEVLTR